MVHLNVLTCYIQKWPSHHGTRPHWRHPKNCWSAPEPNPSQASAWDDFRHIYRRWLILNFQKQNNMQCNTVCNKCGSLHNIRAPCTNQNQSAGHSGRKVAHPTAQPPNAKKNHQEAVWELATASGGDRRLWRLLGWDTSASSQWS